MSNDKLSVEQKQNDLIKFRDLVIATIDYHLETPNYSVKTDDFDSNEHFELLKKQTQEYFNKGRLTRSLHGLSREGGGMLLSVILGFRIKLAKFLNSETFNEANEKQIISG